MHVVEGARGGMLRLLLLPEERRAHQGWRRCGESAVAMNLDSEEKTGREMGAEANSLNTLWM